MNGVFKTDDIKNLLAPLLEKGFTFSYTNEKGGDSSCSYISRFRKGKDFFDWREVSGSEEISFVVYADGRYRFPDLRVLYKKEMRKFAFKHLFKRATLVEKRVFYAQLLLKEFAAREGEFFGIKY